MTAVGGTGAGLVVRGVKGGMGEGGATLAPPSPRLEHSRCEMVNTSPPNPSQASSSSTNVSASVPTCSL